MFKVSSSLLLSALVLGAVAFRPSGACPYLAAQDRQSGLEADVVAGTAPHPMVRKLQAEELSNKAEVPEIQAEELGNKEESPVSLNHHVDRQLFFIFDWFQAILDFFFGFFSNGGAGDSSSDDNGGRGGGDNGGNDGGGDDGDGDGNQGGGGDFDDTPFQGSVQESLTAARQDIIGIMDAPKFVRLAFHSCVGGVCDGCVDTSVPDNFGLDEPIEDLEPIVTKYAAQLTRADVWILAGMTAAEVAQNGGGGGGGGRGGGGGGGGGGGDGNNNGTPPVPFPMQFVGRPSCSNPQGGPPRDMPSAHLHTQEVLDFFRTSFEFMDRDTVAILGAHTLGRAVPQNSGFDGRDGWVPNRNRLDNQFYNVLLDNNEVDNDFQLELQNNDDRPEFPNQFLWRRGNDNDDQFMLNVDMSLAFDLADHITPVTGAVSCNVNTCPESPLMDITREFAQNNDAWLQAFRVAFTKMTSVGCPGICTALPQ